MASSPSKPYSIKLCYKKIFGWRTQAKDPTAGELIGEPLLMLRFLTKFYLEGDTVCYLVTTQHKFTDYSISFLNDIIKQEEPPPMDDIIDSEVLEMTRVNISVTIACLVRNCIDFAGLKGLHVDIIFKFFEEHQEDDHMGDEEMEDIVEILPEWRMALVKKVYMGDVIGTCSSTSMKDKEVCSICLEEMVEEGKEVLCTPCSHQFHVQCIEQWFEKNNFCPLCRLNVGY